MASPTIGDRVPEAFSHLLSPIQIGPKLVRNRLLVTGHAPRLAKDNKPSDDYIAYQRARARGGAGLQITGAAGVHPTGVLAGAAGLRNVDDGIIPGYRALADAIHTEGGLILGQLAHSGATVGNSDAGRPLWAPSPIGSELTREIPHEMTVSEIQAVIDAYYAAAQRVRDGGLDGAEVLAAFGFLVVAFLSPLTNKRLDAYGGSAKNRRRFVLEVLAAARAGLGPDRILGLRIPGDEDTPDGLSAKDMIGEAKAFAATGHIDYLNVIYGTNMKRMGRMKHWPPTPAPHGLFVEYAAAIKQGVDIPVFTVGRITDPRMADAIIRDGKADMVGMTRAHIADPDIGRKIVEGHVETIRPCVGANVCITLAGAAIRCFGNPDAGREAHVTQEVPAPHAKTIVVVGGGPAGLEAARTAAARGHQVTVYEQGPKLGGQLRLWADTPDRGEFHKLLNWYEAALMRAQVRVVLNHTFDVGTLDGRAVDEVILATGSKAAAPQRVEGHKASPIVFSTPRDVLETPPSNAGPDNSGHVLLFDEGGDQTGLAAVMKLVESGWTASIATTEFVIGEHIDPVVRTPLYQRLLKADVRLLPNERLVRVEDRDAVLRNMYSDQETMIGSVDLILDWRGNAVNDALLTPLQDAGITVYTAGDCVAPRKVHIAIAEGAMAGRAV